MRENRVREKLGRKHINRNFHIIILALFSFVFHSGSVSPQTMFVHRKMSRKQRGEGWSITITFPWLRICVHHENAFNGSFLHHVQPHKWAVVVFLPWILLLLITNRCENHSVETPMRENCWTESITDTVMDFTVGEQNLFSSRFKCFSIFKSLS